MSLPASPQRRVVAIGGGTGLSTLLRGLKQYVTPPSGSASPSACNGQPCRIAHLAGIVTVTDDGGSSGRLREDLKMLPPGDVRNCVAALSEDEQLLTRLFRYRFPSDEPHGLAGHSFGNLFLAALTAITDGDFAQAVQMSSQILAARGHIYPATNANVTLTAHMDDGSIVHGETSISAAGKRIAELTLDPADAVPLPEAIDAIRTADLITVGPGSLYTSLITNLLVRDIAEAIVASSATRVFVCNLMTQAHESVGLSAADHIERIQSHCDGRRIFDFAILNTAPIAPHLLARYAEEGQTPIEADAERIRALGVTPILGDFAHQAHLLRHDYDRVAATLLDLHRLM